MNEGDDREDERSLDEAVATAPLRDLNLYGEITGVHRHVEGTFKGLASLRVDWLATLVSRIDQLFVRMCPFIYRLQYDRNKSLHVKGKR